MNILSESMCLSHRVSYVIVMLCEGLEAFDELDTLTGNLMP